ncbi:MAG: hypothetical protein JO345_07105 [Streptosporangiaceae bacterium]|nr:hypothetical protein [Streptosporangiaceae bacterium]
MVSSPRSSRSRQTSWRPIPHPVAGSAADPIALEPVDDVVVTTLVDNVYDALLTGDDSITRSPLAAGTAQAPQFEPGRRA